MEIRELKTFLQVAKQSSFCKAADVLGYSQAAVTIQIKSLERDLGVQLFDRIGKRISLTHAGTTFYQYALNVIRDLNHVKGMLSESAQLQGMLVIGTIESVCSSLLPPLAAEFHRLYPNVALKIVVDTPNVLLSMLNANTLDLVYFLDRRIYDAKWIKVLEQPEAVIFAASTRFPLAGKKQLSIDEVIAQPMLLTEYNASYRLALEQRLAAAGKSIRPFLEIGDTGFIVTLLRDNAGISFLPEFTVRADIACGSLTALDVADFQLRTWRQLVYHKDKWVSREMKAFIALVQEKELGADA